MSDELKPCPFCGGEAELVDISSGTGKAQFAVVCGACGASSKAYKPFGNYKRSWHKEASVIEAQEYTTKAWNRRVTNEQN